MRQTKLESLIESLTNTTIGFWVNFSANVAFLPILFDPERPYTSAAWIGVVFTVISVIRSYFVRRLYDHPRFRHALRAVAAWLSGGLTSWRSGHEQR